MSFFSKAKRAVRHYVTMKAARKKLGLTGKSKFLRQLKRSLRGRTGQQMALGGYQPTNAVNYQPRTIASLMGGV